MSFQDLLNLYPPRWERKFNPRNPEFVYPAIYSGVVPGYIYNQGSL